MHMYIAILLFIFRTTTHKHTLQTKQPIFCKPGVPLKQYVFEIYINDIKMVSGSILLRCITALSKYTRLKYSNSTVNQS